MTRTSNFRQFGTAWRKPVAAIGQRMTGKPIVLAVLAVLGGALCLPTPASAFTVGFGGIRFHVPGGVGGYRGHHHDGGGGGRHHSHDGDDDSASSDELTRGKGNDLAKGKVDETTNLGKLDPKAKGPTDKVAADPAEGSGGSTASGALKPGQALASDPTAVPTSGPTLEASALYEHGPDLTPVR